MSLWDMSVKWLAEATLWDWVWHIVACILVVVFSVPHIFWRWVKPYFKKNEDKQGRNEGNVEVSNQR
ncbi:MAG: hypothetical protein WCC10_07680 [Tumebacillaceae bacterium]